MLCCVNPRGYHWLDSEVTLSSFHVRVRGRRDTRAAVRRGSAEMARLVQVASGATWRAGFDGSIQYLTDDLLRDSLGHLSCDRRGSFGGAKRALVFTI